MTNIRLAASRVTEANLSTIIEGLKGKSKREAELFLATINPDGTVSEVEPTVDLKVTCSQSTIEKLDRAKQVLSSCGKNPKTSDIIDQALEALLEKKDPMKKAERAKTREEKKAVKTDTSTVKGKEEEPKKSGSHRQYIPAKNRHEVYRRDEGRCTHIDHQGVRCSERSMIEIDHKVMVCRGGNNSLENLRLLCRRHNQKFARDALGEQFMKSKISAHCLEVAVFRNSG